jgi:hypothetical protein
VGEIMRDSKNTARKVNVKVDTAFIRTMMDKRGIRSQRELARLSGLNQSVVHYILDPDSTINVSYQSLAKIAAALGSAAYVSDMVIVEEVAPEHPQGNGNGNN